MDTTLKGALAAGAAAVLLVGGAGTLAFWSDTSDVETGTINAGDLSLGVPDCGDWVLNGGATFTSQLIVPGDTITQTCTLDLVATGDSNQATLGIATPAFSPTNALTGELTPTAAFKVNGATQTAVTDADDTGTDEIEVVVTVDFPYAPATNASKTLTAQLDDITLTLSQTDATP